MHIDNILLVYSSLIVTRHNNEMKSAEAAFQSILTKCPNLIMAIKRLRAFKNAGLFKIIYLILWHQN